MRTKVNNEKTIISVFDTDKKSLIGVFLGFSKATRYLFNADMKNASKRVLYCWQSKSRLTTDLGITVAIRTASDEHIKLLGEDDYYIAGEYKAPRQTRMNGYTSTRYIMYNEHVVNKYYK